MSIEQMYQEIILDHYRAKHHSGLRDPYEAEVTHVNPSCGDEILLRVHLEGDVVADISYDAVGCSISQASTSVMTDLVIGNTVDEALATERVFHEMMHSQGKMEPDEDVLEDAVAFIGVAQFPARVKCALLGWSAWKDAVAQALAARGATQRAEQGGLEMTTESRPSDLVRDVLPDALASTPSMRPSVEDIEEAMREVVDPELMVNVVDLGLLYGVHLDEDNNCTLDMTLTSPTCPLTDRLEYDTQMALEGLVASVTINWVWLPPWTLNNITDDGREQLRAIGYNL